MKKLITLLSAILLSVTVSTAQTFWTENFESGSTSGEIANAYTGPNGAWTVTTGISTAEGSAPNPWYISCAEAGHIAGACGSAGCSALSLGATLHIGSGSGSFAGADNGASYDAGGLSGLPGGYTTTTDRRAESPTINCTGKTSITAKFYYIENGDGTNDDGSVYYSADNGATWSLLVNTPKTTVCGSGQGQWAAYSIALPASANNNPTVKIGFRWVNNDDGVGTDPSFAIDSLSLSTPASATAPVASFTSSSSSTCQDSCIALTSTSTGTVDSIKWKATGGIITSATVSPTNICFTTAGTYSVTLIAYNAAGADSSSSVITVNPAPHPAITKSGHTLSVTGSYTTYQWVNGLTPITGATNAAYTYTVSGLYSVIVDSAGCPGLASFSTLGINTVNNTIENYRITSQGSNTIMILADQPLNENLIVTMYDATGRKLTAETWSNGTAAKELVTGNIPPGLYIIKLNNTTTNIVLRWMKQ